MQRRNFIKFLLGVSACACAGCSFKKEHHSFKNSIDLIQIKIPICYHCNLNCAYCSHFSPIAPKYEMPVEVFERDLAQLKKISNNKISRISLLGGEPLLHKNIKELIKILNRYFPENEKRITTNGLLLKDMDDDFWRVCKENNIIFKYSPYAAVKNYKNLEKEIQKLSKKYDIEIRKYTDDVYDFELMNLSKKTSKNDENKYETCEKKYACPLLDNGKLYPCEVIGSIRFFNNYFKEYAIPTTKNDYLDIYKISSIDEIYEFFNKPKDFCKYCSFGHNIKKAPWKLSNKEVDEWYDINKKG